MAEGLLRDAVKNRKDIEVASAGVGATWGQPPSPHAVEVLRPWGIHIGDLRSQPISDELVDWADLILVMTRGHLETMMMLFPEAADKVQLVCSMNEELRGQMLDVPDPIGLGIHAYFETRDTLKKAIPGILQYLNSTSFMTPSNTSPSSSAAVAPVRPMRIAIAADHGGVELKQAIRQQLSRKGHIVSDFGAYSHESVDYPDYAEPVCRDVLADKADFGILVCKSGIGMSIAAKRSPHIRASLVANPDDAKMTRMHNDSNVLFLSANHVMPA